MNAAFLIKKSETFKSIDIFDFDVTLHVFNDSFRFYNFSPVVDVKQHDFSSYFIQADVSMMSILKFESVKIPITRPNQSTVLGQLRCGEHPWFYSYVAGQIVWWSADSLKATLCGCYKRFSPGQVILANQKRFGAMNRHWGHFESWKTAHFSPT